jgi:hypothetical protein
MNFQNQNVRMAFCFIAGLIVGVGVYGLATRDRPKMPILANNTATTTSEIATSSATITIGGDNGLAVSNQNAGSSVVIAQVVLAEPSWIAIHDSVYGEPGRILGAQYFKAGKTSGTITLLRKTVPGTTYLAVVHKDRGVLRNFNSATDEILKDGSGSMVMISFTTN